MKYCRTCGREYEAALDYCPEDGDRLRDLPHSSGPRLAIGDVVDGRYRIEGLLGAGGMGWVYRATQRSVERTIALKILPPSLARDEVAIGRFMREAKTGCPSVGLAPISRITSAFSTERKSWVPAEVPRVVFRP